MGRHKKNTLLSQECLNKLYELCATERLSIAEIWSGSNFQHQVVVGIQTNRRGHSCGCLRQYHIFHKVA